MSGETSEFFVFVRREGAAAMPRLIGPFGDVYAANRCAHRQGLGEPGTWVWVLQPQPAAVSS